MRWLIVLGSVLAAACGGTTMAPTTTTGGSGGSGGGSGSPTATITSITPAGTALMGSTTIAFTAQTVSTTPAANYAWAFGDGATASSTSPTATHVYSTLPSGSTTQGTFTVTLTVSSGTNSATATGSVAVGSVAGCWLDDSNGPTTGGGFRNDGHLLIQIGSAISGVFTRVGGQPTDSQAVKGDVNGPAPRNINYTRADGERIWTLQMNSAFTKMTGNEHDVSRNSDTAISLTRSVPPPSAGCGG